MKDVIRRRERVARVRRVQHLQAAAQAAQAEGRVASLENSDARLVQLRTSLDLAPGLLSGAALSNVGELAMRLDQAREGLTDAIRSARASALHLAALRLEARIRQESAERLGEQAQAAFDEARERRASGGRRRRGFIGGDA